MPQLFVKVELRGMPDQTDYSRLHSFMRQRHWYRTITGGQTANLPHATYQATFSNQIPDLATMANQLKASIEGNLWSPALVLILQAENWAISS